VNDLSHFVPPPAFRRPISLDRSVPVTGVTPVWFDRCLLVVVSVLLHVAIWVVMTRLDPPQQQAGTEARSIEISLDAGAPPAPEVGPAPAYVPLPTWEAPPELQVPPLAEPLPTEAEPEPAEPLPPWEPPAELQYEPLDEPPPPEPEPVPEPEPEPPPPPEPEPVPEPEPEPPPPEPKPEPPPKPEPKPEPPPKPKPVPKPEPKPAPKPEQTPPAASAPPPSPPAPAAPAAAPTAPVGAPADRAVGPPLPAAAKAGAPVVGPSALTPPTEKITPAHTRADYLKNPEPEYPSIARRRGWEGTVQLRVRVLENGKPDTIEMVKSSGKEALDEAAIAAVRRWTFVPAKRGEQAVVSSVIVPVTFKLRK